MQKHVNNRRTEDTFMKMFNLSSLETTDTQDQVLKNIKLFIMYHKIVYYEITICFIDMERL